MPILFKERDIVVPGEIIAQGKYNAGEGTFRDNDKIVANVVGLVYVTGKDIRITSLQGTYKPREGDIVIGQVTDTSLRTWKVNIRAPWAGRRAPGRTRLPGRADRPRRAALRSACPWRPR